MRSEVSTSPSRFKSLGQLPSQVNPNVLVSATRSDEFTTPSSLKSAIGEVAGAKETMRDVAVLASISGRVVITSSE